MALSRILYSASIAFNSAFIIILGTPTYAPGLAGWKLSVLGACTLGHPRARRTLSGSFYAATQGL